MRKIKNFQRKIKMKIIFGNGEKKLPQKRELRVLKKGLSLS